MRGSFSAPSLVGQPRWGVEPAGRRAMAPSSPPVPSVKFVANESGGVSRLVPGRPSIASGSTKMATRAHHHQQQQQPKPSAKALRSKSLPRKSPALPPPLTNSVASVRRKSSQPTHNKNETDSESGDQRTNGVAPTTSVQESGAAVKLQVLSTRVYL